jgi:hypothetical protein
MAKRNKSVEVEHVACEICLKEVPVTEAIIPEATDYFVHFCGVDCYDKWKRQGAKPKDRVKNPGS